MHTVLLLIHIAGAGYAGLLLLQTIIALLRNQSDTYQSYAQKIAGVLVLQVISGCVLVIESQKTLSTLEFCSTFSLYFVPIVAIETILFARMNQNLIERFPLAYVTRAFCLSLFVATGTLLAQV